MIPMIKRLEFVQPLYHFHWPDYSWQVCAVVGVRANGFAARLSPTTQLTVYI